MINKIKSFANELLDWLFDLTIKSLILIFVSALFVALNTLLFLIF